MTWPNLIRLAWPAYTNEVVFLFHATALVYFTLPVIGDQQDLMNMAEELFERDYNAFLHFSVAALYFLAISLLIFFLFGLIYRRLMRHMPRRADEVHAASDVELMAFQLQTVQLRGDTPGASTELHALQDRPRRRARRRFICRRRCTPTSSPAPWCCTTCCRCCDRPTSRNCCARASP